MQNFWRYAIKYFFITLVATAVFVGVALQVPMLRRSIFCAMDKLAAWHEKGTQEEAVSAMTTGEVKGEDPFLLARAGEKLGRR